MEGCVYDGCDREVFRACLPYTQGLPAVYTGPVCRIHKSLYTRA